MSYNYGSDKYEIFGLKCHDFHFHVASTDPESESVILFYRQAR